MITLDDTKEAEARELIALTGHRFFLVMEMLRDPNPIDVDRLDELANQGEASIDALEILLFGDPLWTPRADDHTN